MAFVSDFFFFLVCFPISRNEGDISQHPLEITHFCSFVIRCSRCPLKSELFLFFQKLQRSAFFFIHKHQVENEMMISLNDARNVVPLFYRVMKKKNLFSFFSGCRNGKEKKYLFLFHSFLVNHRRIGMPFFAATISFSASIIVGGIQE